MRLNLFFVFLLTFTLIAGCAQDERPTSVSEQVTAPAEIQNYFSVAVGTSGGVVTGDHTQLVIPQGALGSATVIQMTTSVIEGKNHVEFGPAGLQFNDDCILTMDLPDPLDPDATYHIFWLDPIAASWVDYGGTVSGDQAVFIAWTPDSLAEVVASRGGANTLVSVCHPEDWVGGMANGSVLVKG